MGAILSLLRGGSAESDPIDIPIDFNGLLILTNYEAPPTAAEVDYQKFQTITEAFPQWIKTLEGYSGCGEFIRQAISSPGKANEEAAWAAILPAVAKLKDLYEFAMQLESIFPKLVAFLTSEDSAMLFEKYQASAYQLATIINFSLQFDLLKMGNPSIQNDFSYYRRTVSRMKLGSASGSIVVSDELANRMSLFFAHSNPVSKALIDSLTSSVTSRSLNTGRVVECFGILAGVSYNTLIREKTAPQGDLLYLRVMVGSILFYDHIDPVGAFAKESAINIKSSVKVIQSKGQNLTDPLLNVLKFSTLHLNAESTPKATKQLLS